MMYNKKYFYDTEANNDINIRIKALIFALSIAEKDKSISRIVLYLSSKKNTGWFKGIFDPLLIDQLFKGYQYNKPKVLIKIESTITYQRSPGYSDVVIAFGTRTKELCELEDIHSVKYIISIPWVKSETEEWIKSRNAINAETGEKNLIKLPSLIVCIALQQLTNSINLSTGISYPTDNETAKKYIRALYKYEEEPLKGLDVEAYLVNNLNWKSQDAKQVRDLVDRLNNGRNFQGGSTTSLLSLYEHWKELASKQENS